MEGTKMLCPKCQFDNADGMNFCGKCGNRLELFCPQCNFGNPGDYGFCGKCGFKLSHPSETVIRELSFDEKLAKIQKYLPKGLTDKILSQRDKIEGERKQVTVMFCDMEGFTQLSEKLGPEDAYVIMDKVYELLIHKVHEYDGTVNEMTGDGIMALFGAPIALEDAPQRAIRAAYAIHREMNRLNEGLEIEKSLPHVKMRIGIHTGPVVVGTLGNNLRVEFKAVGDTVNLASRMEGIAESGTTYVTEDTFKLTEGLFRFEALGELIIKGKKNTIRAYRVLAPSNVRTRFDVNAERGLTTFVGRQRELEILFDCLDRVRNGSGQAVSIVAEAGLGKSRLLYEFRKAVTNDNLTFLEGKCLSYSSNVAYHLYTDILKATFNIREGDNDSEIIERVKKGLKVLGADEERTLPYLLELLPVKEKCIGEIPIDPELLKDRIKETLRHIIILGSELSPLILAYEDIHWADSSSEELLSYILDSIPGANVLIIFTYRPEFLHTWGVKSFHNQLTLNRLSNRESLTMVNNILDSNNLDKDLEELILTKTEGVPFFIEEFLKSLKDLRIIERIDSKYQITKDISQVTIPATIQDMIMARVDSLPDTARKLLQIASMIEREFKYELIKQVVGSSETELLNLLSILKESELLFERGIYPQSTYIFKHSLTREVVYKSMLLKKRREIHGKIGKSILYLYSKRLEEFYEVLSHHFYMSNDLLNALKYLKLSGLKAIRKQSYREAYHFYKESLEVLSKLPNTEENKREQLEITNLMYVPTGLGNVGMPEEYLNILQKGETLAVELGEIRSVINIQSLIGSYYDFKGEREKALLFTKKSFEAAQAAKDIELIGSTSFVLSTGYWSAGLYSDLANIIPSVLDLLEKNGKQLERLMGRNFNQYSNLCGMCGLAHFCLGDFQKGEIYFEKGLQTAIAFGQDQTTGMVEYRCGLGYLVKGDWKFAAQHLKSSIKCLKKAKLANTLGHALSALGYVRSHLDDLETAKKNIEDGIAIKKESWIETGLAYQYFDLGHCQLKLGDLVGARDSVEKALELSERHHEKLIEGRSLITLGKVLSKLQPTEIDQAEGSIKNGIGVLEELKSKPFLSIGYLVLGQFYADIGLQDESKKNLHLAECMFQEMGMDYWLHQTQEILSRL